MQMPKKLLKKWLKALRSGEYGQVKGTLTDGKGGFCCLGVLQHVASGGSCETNDHCEPGGYCNLPSGDWYRENGIDVDPDTEDALTEMNDGGTSWKTGRAVKRRAKNFSAIADYIEKNVVGV